MIGVLRRRDPPPGVRDVWSAAGVRRPAVPGAPRETEAT
ncbi:TPA_asm: UL15 uoORF [Human alphaherpesvirus 1]|nr:TPA_asm: UL15 uoORF [Human alphaherpesvirus 1]